VNRSECFRTTHAVDHRASKETSMMNPVVAAVRIGLLLTLSVAIAGCATHRLTGTSGGFTVDVVGLPGERVTDVFGTLRDGCPHKGVDYSSSQRPMDFQAGIYGTVVEPEESGWGTVAVVPHDNPDFKVQYLHTSSRYVAVGDVVQPWTILGATGDTAPPGTGITGIHLHLQVQAVNAPSSHACWSGREFVDPASWTIRNPLVGTWVSNSSETIKGVTIEDTKQMRIDGDAINSPITGDGLAVAVTTSASGKLYRAEEKTHWNARVIGQQKHTMLVEAPAGTCSTTVNGAPAPWQCHANPSVFEIRMLSADKLQAISRDGSIAVWRKAMTSAAAGPVKQRDELAAALQMSMSNVSLPEPQADPGALDAWHPRLLQLRQLADPSDSAAMASGSDETATTLEGHGLRDVSGSASPC
jgi:murein DD-endopeptidase MepM/ murein hydrolase activator NlpD